MTLKIEEVTGDAAKEVFTKDLDVIRSPHYRAIYANLAGTGMSTMDLRVTFSVIRDIEPKKLGIEEEIAIIMTPPFAQAVAQMLMRNIQMWQDKYNQLEPEEIQAMEAETKKASEAKEE